ncbi:enterotoxin domain protein, partial [Vibrio harveyi]
RDLS